MSIGIDFYNAVNGVAAGTISAYARWLPNSSRANVRRLLRDAAFIAVVGAFNGFMGTALAHALDYDQWSGISAGILGAIGGFGVEVAVRSSNSPK